MKPPKIDDAAANLARMAFIHAPEDMPDSLKLDRAFRVYEWAKRNTAPFGSTGALRSYPSWTETQAAIRSWT